MQRLLLLLLPFLRLSTLPTRAAWNKPCASRWKNRVLLVAAPRAAQADFQRKKQLLAAAQSRPGRAATSS